MKLQFDPKDSMAEKIEFEVICFSGDIILNWCQESVQNRVNPPYAGRMNPCRWNERSALKIATASTGRLTALRALQ